MIFSLSELDVLRLRLHIIEEQYGGDLPAALLHAYMVLADQVEALHAIQLRDLPEETVEGSQESEAAEGDLPPSEPPESPPDLPPGPADKERDALAQPHFRVQAKKR